MPMSQSFKERLFPRLPEIADHFGTPFHIYDERGILETGEGLKQAFSGIEGFKEFFAVKALPNIEILRLMLRMGFGFDCSSIPELVLARRVGARPEDIIFTSNNTSQEEFRFALKSGGCILNLDDITMVPKVPGDFPELICFRYNPGERRAADGFIGKPVEAKYGVRHDQIIGAYSSARNRGAKRFGLHTMIISNELNYQYMVETIRMLLQVIKMVYGKLGILFQFINIGGGVGTPYRPEQSPFDIATLGKEASGLLAEFREQQGYAPKLFMESGRYMTGSHGVLVTRVINRMSKYREYVGVDACMSSLMRPAMYDAYHHIDVLNLVGAQKDGPTEIVDVVGSLCENNDKFAKQRALPQAEEGDLLVIHNTGAHGIAMGFNYNGRLRPKELILRSDGSVELIRRAEDTGDYLRTMLDFKSDVLAFKEKKQSPRRNLTRRRR